MPKHQDLRRGRPSHSDDDRKLPGRNRRGEEGRNTGEHEIFVEQVQRRLGGGASPTAEAYAKAMQQWQSLAGAVQFVAVPSFPDSDPEPTPPAGGQPQKPKTGGDIV